MMQEGEKKDGVVSMEKEGRHISYYVSEDFGIQVLTAKDSEGIYTDIRQSLLLAGCLTLACFVGCMIAVVIIANKLAKPIESLR